MTPNNFVKISIVGSIVAHILLLAIIITGTKNDEISTRFVVLGAHSKNVLNATYKSMPLPGGQKASSGKAGTNIQSAQPKTTKKQALKPKAKLKAKVQNNKRTIPKKEKTPLKKMPTSIVEENKALKTPNKLRRQESDSMNEPIKKKGIKKKETEEVKEKKTLPSSQKNLKSQKNTSREDSSEENGSEFDDEDNGSARDSASSGDATGNSNEIEAVGIDLSKLNKELTVYQECVRKEVLRLWSPPVGIPKGTECTLHFVISDTGKVSHVDFIKRSKMLLYDLSIQQIAYRFDFDKRLWGKQFTIDFRQ